MKEKIILKSANPELYGDLEIECRVLENKDIKGYIDNQPEENKIVAYKVGEVTAREGMIGEEINTVLKVEIDGKEYILHEEKGTVRKRLGKKGLCEQSEQYEEQIDMVVTNISNPSKEEYIVKREKFDNTYIFQGISEEGIQYVPVYEPRELTKVNENLIIVTAWGAKAICLSGSYIVTYNAEENDFNVLEEESYNKTYKEVENRTKKRKREQ